MMHRTGGSRGNARIDLVLPGLGRFRISSGTTRASAFRRRVSLVRLLAELGQLEVLRALQAGRLRWPELEQAQRQQRLTDPTLGAQLRLARPLRQAIEETLPLMGKPVTRERYRVGLQHLGTLGVLTETATVRDLLRDDWAERLAGWAVAPATKNGVRTAVSRFLSRYLGDKFDPFRRAVLHEDRWPRLKVAPRVSGLDAGAFWVLMGHIPERLHSAFLVLAATGMRVGEYLNDAALSVDPLTCTITTAGKTGPKVYAYAPAIAAHVRAAVPCRISEMRHAPTRLQNDPRYRRLRRAFARASAAAGIPCTIHDLRRLYVRLGVDALGEIKTQHAVGHETPSMTRDYARAQSGAEVAVAVAAGLGLPGVARHKAEGGS